MTEQATQHRHDGTAPSLTRNQALVLDTLTAAEGPLTAYNILDRLSGDGLRAPLQVYRALDKLVEAGLAHRLESLNAFVACCHSDCDGHATVAFTICGQCGRTEEIRDESLESALSELTSRNRFRARKTTIEIRGDCGDCSRD